MILEEVIEVTEETKDFWMYVKDYLTPQTITVITTVICFLIALLRLLSSVKTLRTQKAMTLQNVLTELKKYVDMCKDNEIKSAIETIINPLVAKVDSINPVLETFSKILALSQENTPESKIAILNLIQDLGKIDVKVIEQANETIEIQEQEKKEQRAEIEESIIRPIE